ncbi:MAG: beta-galactosidase [Planctomycetota bacterium]
MAKITYDGQSFSLDHRRIWLVSGAIHYPRIARGLWRDRIRAAKQAGLNCIETYAFWNAHEPEPGRFDFTGNLDVRRFVEIVAEEGMFCIFRPGPYICAEWDNGGLPAWLHRVKKDRRSGTMKIREGNGPFLSAASRYLTAVMGQVADLQITSPIGRGRPAAHPTVNAPGEAAGGFVGQGGGPILMVQVENEWFSHNDEQDEQYHQQLIRLLREAGADVPLNVCNQLWQEVDGTIHTWNGSAHLAADLRQLRTVQPDKPRLMTEYWPGWFDAWGSKHANTVDADKHLYRLASILAAGAQYNVFMFHGGTNFEFWGGRTVGSPATFMTTSYDYDAPLLEAGGRAQKYATTKRMSTFASQFGSVFSHLDPARHPAVIDPREDDHPLSVVHLAGQRGGVVFLLKDAKDRTQRTALLLPNGLSLPVPLGSQRAAWLLLDARLGATATLDFTNLSPLAWVDEQLLVLFGPANAEGIVSLDGAQVEMKVPAGKTPRTEQVNGITLLVLNTEMADASYAFAGGWVVGSAGLDQDGEPQPLKGWPTQTRVAPDGRVTKYKTTTIRKPVTPKLGPWRHADTRELLDGSAPSYRPIDGPESFDKLGNDRGYGWIHLDLPKAALKNTASKVLAPEAADRLHFYVDGKFRQLLGNAPGATDFAPAAFRIGSPMTVLVDNLGRFNYGQRVGETKGLASHLYAVTPLKLPKPERVGQPSPDPFAVHGYVSHQRRGSVHPAEGLVWTVKPSGRQPVVFDLDHFPADAVLKINGEPTAVWHHHESGAFQRFLLDPADDGPFSGGQNRIELALFDPLPPDIDPLRHVGLYQATTNLTAKAKWSFSPWTGPPASDAFADPAPPARAKSKPLDRPAWYRTAFTVSSTRCPLFFYPKGMSKGQLYLNGRNLGRYFIQTRDRQPVPPQLLYYLPEPWLNTDEANELTVFDEHGFPPTNARLAYEELGPFH